MSEDTFREKLPGFVASGLSAVTCTVGLSFLGTSGTLYGLALGSVASGVVQWQYERHIRKAKAAAAKLRADIHARRHPQDIHQTIMMNAIAKEEEEKIPRGVPWRLIIAGAVTSLAGLLALIAFIELGAGKPISDVVRNKAGHGSTFSGGTVTQPTPSLTPTWSPTPTVSATLSPSVAPSPTLSTPTPSPSTVPPTVLPSTSASPTASAGGTPDMPPQSP